MNPLQAFLAEQEDSGLLSWQSQERAAKKFELPLLQVEDASLEMGILPARYSRQVGLFGIKGQLLLCRAKVAVIGCGGLGGYLLEGLGRLGVGNIVAVDPDRFEEHNLNRQLLAAVEDLGRLKVEVAVERLASINPVVQLTAVAQAFGQENSAALLQGVQVVVDALDSAADRRQLSVCCHEHGVSLVHGAVGGWYGQLAVQMPGGPGLGAFYPESAAEQGVEQQLGTPAFAPVVIAGLQMAEVCKLLLGNYSPLQHEWLSLDLKECDYERFPR